MNNNQKLFCQEHILKGKSATKSYMEVYNVKDENKAASSASRLLRNVKVQEYINGLQEKTESKSIKTAIEKRELLNRIFNGEECEIAVIEGVDVKLKPKMADRLKAIDIDNKMAGEYIENINLKGSVEINPYNNLSEEELRKLAS